MAYLLFILPYKLTGVNDVMKFNHCQALLFVKLLFQIADQFSILGQPLNLRVCIVTGGSDQLEESLKLAKRPHIVVAMPGRLADHITGCDTFTLKKIRYLVLDEADR